MSAAWLGQLFTTLFKMGVGGTPLVGAQMIFINELHHIVQTLVLYNIMWFKILDNTS